jgi:hypothetical protein
MMMHCTASEEFVTAGLFALLHAICIIPLSWYSHIISFCSFMSAYSAYQYPCINETQFTSAETYPLLQVTYAACLCCVNLFVGHLMTLALYMY